MTECKHDEPSTPELDAAVARQALAEGDVAHAALHVSRAIGADPLRDDHIALLDELLRVAPRPFELFDLSWYGPASVRALLLHRAGKHDDALRVLAAIFAAVPDVPFFAWTAQWPAPSSEEVLMTLLQRTLSASTESEAAWQPVSDALNTWLTTLEPGTQLLSLVSIVHRRAGRFESATHSAQASLDIEPTWSACVALANARRAAGDELGMVAAWDQALDLQPDDLSVHLDWGEWLLTQERWSEAVSRFQRVLDVEAEHFTAWPSQLYARYRQHPTVSRRLALRAWAKATPESERATMLSDSLTPWVGWLPTTGEASLRALQGELADDQRVTLKVNYLESPSLMLELAAAERVEATWESVPEPDPREPRMQGARPLWTWDELEPSPALPFPPRPVRTAVANLAIHRYHGRRWAIYATDHLEHDAWELLAAAQHPSDVEGIAPWAWRYHLALAAGALLAGKVGWHGTEHREALRCMVATRGDWLTIGALAALVERAERDPACREDVQSWLAACWNDPPSQGHWLEGWLVTDGLVRMGAVESDLQNLLLPALISWEEAEPEA